MWHRTGRHGPEAAQELLEASGPQLRVTPLARRRTPTPAFSRALALCFLAAASCVDIVGLDEYVREMEVPACTGAQVLGDGGCEPVGVPYDECGAGFAPDGRGGCIATLPSGPCVGQLARPGEASCAKPRCTPRPSASSGAAPVYVRASAAEGGTGSATRPFARIADAIAVVSEPNPEIIVEAGEYRENLVMTRPMHLIAACDVRMSAQADRPAFRIEGRGASGITRIEGFEIVGGSAGIEARDVAELVVSDTQLRDSDGPGLLADASAASQITLRRVLIENARGAGAAVYGVHLAIEDSTIRGTRTGAEGEDQCGVCMRPSGRVRPREWPGLAAWDARTSNVGSLRVERSLLEDNAGAGVSVIGTRDATVSGSVIRAANEAQAIGIDVEERVLGNLPARLHVSQSLVEGTTLIGIRARNAYLEIDGTTVRDIRGAADSRTERCLGNGVRVIWDRKSEAVERALQLRDSLIERTHESGVLIQGAQASIERSLIRDSQGARCGDELGDGIAVYAHEFAPAVLHLRKTRIERSVRAAVASFGGATLDVRSSAALGADIYGKAKGVRTLPDTWCGDAKGARGGPCVVRPYSLTSPLLDSPRCNPDDETVCIAVCSHESGYYGGVAAGVAPDRRFWIIGHDEIAPVRAGADGCAEIEGLPRNARVALATAVRPEPAFVPVDAGMPLGPFTRAFAPALNQVDTGSSDADFRVWLAGHYAYELIEDIATLPTASDASGLDLRAAPVFAVGICDATRERRLSTGVSCRPLAGVAVALDRGTLANPSVGSMDSASARNPIGAGALFVNVPPGPRRLELTSADRRRKLECWTDTGAGWGTATALAADNVFEVIARPAYAFNTTLLCELREPED